MTSNDPLDQASALSNLDQVPYASGTGKGVTLSQKLQNGQSYCTPNGYVTNTTYCPNNAANFGSVTGTIGGARAVTMGVNITF